MSEDRRTLEERADAYLDGDLSRDDALAFERELAVRPEVAAALASALALRELLLSLPPLAPPAGLAQRITRALPLGRASRQETAAEPALSPVRAVLGAFGWTFRATAAATMGAVATAGSVSGGLNQVRWALGPLGASDPAPRARRPLWRRLLFGKVRG